jgi:hypothetical protein
MSEFYQQAKVRMPSQKQTILKLLKQSGSTGVLNTELNKISLSYSDRLYQLKMEGYEFSVENLGNGLCNYVLTKEPDSIVKQTKKGIDLIIEEIEGQYNGIITSDNLVDIMDKLNLNAIRKPNTLKVEKVG